MKQTMILFFIIMSLLGLDCKSSWRFATELDPAERPGCHWFKSAKAAVSADRPEFIFHSNPEVALDFDAIHPDWTLIFAQDEGMKLIAPDGSIPLLVSPEGEVKVNGNTRFTDEDLKTQLQELLSLIYSVYQEH